MRELKGKNHWDYSGNRKRILELGGERFLKVRRKGKMQSRKMSWEYGKTLSRWIQ